MTLGCTRVDTRYAPYEIDWSRLAVDVYGVIASPGLKDVVDSHVVEYDMIAGVLTLMTKVVVSRSVVCTISVVDGGPHETMVPFDAECWIDVKCLGVRTSGPLMTDAPVWILEDVSVSVDCVGCVVARTAEKGSVLNSVVVCSAHCEWYRTEEDPRYVDLM